MKIKTVKIPKQFPYKTYIHKVDRHKFEVNLYEDDGGSLIAKIGKNVSLIREDAKLEDWIDQAQEMSAFYHNLVDFLQEVNYLRGEDEDLYDR